MAKLGEASAVLFVYGSLKQAEANHRELAGARFIGFARTANAFALREIDGYPALVAGDRAISGELFEVSRERLRALDEFEGADYVRQQILLEDGGVAIAYLARSPTAGMPLALSAWPALRS